MKLTFSSERVLAVVAHPDDAELFCAGTLARAKADGAASAICVLCRGDKGQPPKGIARLAEVRHREMAAAAKLLGTRLLWCGYRDGELTDGSRQRRKLLHVFRLFRPTLVLAHAAYDYHPDHRAASALAEAASWLSASPGHKTRRPALETQPALWWMDTLDMNAFQPSFYIDISDYTDLKEQMLRCHRSQLERGGQRDFAPLEELMRRQYRTRGAQAGVVAAEAFRIHHAFKRIRAW
jgi:LmbE family N-acetylglucosaminyl deacetylase